MKAMKNTICSFINNLIQNDGNIDQNIVSNKQKIMKPKEIYFTFILSIKVSFLSLK
jgi:hypothetical protein